MRWKLLIITSVLAALTGVGGSVGLLYLLTGSTSPSRQPDLAAAAVTLLFPLAVITFACVFVYRHTARRRKTQVAATALISLALTLAVFFASTFYIICCEPPLPPSPPAPTPQGAT